MCLECPILYETNATVYKEIVAYRKLFTKEN